MKKYVLIVLMAMCLTAFGQVSSSGAEKDLNKLAFSYGAQAFDMLEIADRIIENQKVVIVLYSGLVNVVEMKVDVLSKAITRIESRTWWQKIWAWIRGAIVGAGIAYLATSI